jgi:hypothetical protein
VKKKAFFGGKFQIAGFLPGSRVTLVPRQDVDPTLEVRVIRTSKRTVKVKTVRFITDSANAGPARQVLSTRKMKLRQVPKAIQELLTM